VLCCTYLFVQTGVSAGSCQHDTIVLLASLVCFTVLSLLQ
jgi:hypothetical protein